MSSLLTLTRLQRLNRLLLCQSSAKLCSLKLTEEDRPLLPHPRVATPLEQHRLELLARDPRLPAAERDRGPRYPRLPAAERERGARDPRLPSEERDRGALRNPGEKSQKNLQQKDLLRLLLL